MIVKTGEIFLFPLPIFGIYCICTHYGLYVFYQLRIKTIIKATFLENKSEIDWLVKNVMKY